MGKCKRRAVIVETQHQTLERLVEAAGFEIVGTAHTAVNGERLVGHFCPDVVVLENELAGVQGWQSIPYLRDLSPASKVVLVVAAGWAETSVGALGAFAVVQRSRVGSLVDVLADVDASITIHSGGAVLADRRTGDDRRVAQDWSKVGWEKRTGTARRVLVAAA